MKAVLLGNEIHQSPEWHALRTNGIGGSEVAAIVGLSPWESRFSLWHRKRGSLGGQQVNDGMDWGTRLEPVVCAKFAETHDMLDVQPAGTYRHHERTWQLANVDRLLFDDEFRPGPVAFLEAKTAHQFDAWEWGKEGTEDIPPYYRCQVMHYLDVLELPVAHVAVLIGGSDYREYQIKYDATEAEWLRAEAEKFWNEVLGGEAPPLDGSDATYEAVRELHPLINGEEVDLDADLYDAYVDTKALAETTATEHKRIKAELLAAMGEARYARVGNKTVLRRQPGRGGSISLYPVNQPKESVA